MSKFADYSIVRVVPGALAADAALAEFAHDLLVIGWRVSPFTGRHEACVSVMGGALAHLEGWIAEADLELVPDGDTADDQFTGNDLGAEMAAAEAAPVDGVA